MAENATELTWLQPLAQSWRRCAEQGRLPHALLLTGTAGTGKRAMAAWIARRRLRLGTPGPLPTHPVRIPEHADLRWLQKPADKNSIIIDQIRELVDALSLTSYEGGAKVAVIDPADIMNTPAANSLLKTLEEPPGDALLILVADRPGRLPATIFSRCQRMHFATPPAESSLAWLERLRPGADWRAALETAGNAPLAAIDALEVLDETRAMGRELAAVAEQRVSPVDVAARWAHLETDFVLGWLGRQVQQLIRRRHDRRPGGPASAVPETVLARMDSRNLFCYLDTINGLRGQTAGSFNVELALESLLIDWAGGLVGYRDAFSPGRLLPVPGQGRNR